MLIFAYMFFLTTCQLPIYADVCFYVCLTTQVYRMVALTLRGSSRETRLASSLSRAAPPDFKIYSTGPLIMDTKDVFSVFNTDTNLDIVGSRLVQRGDSSVALHQERLGG